MTTTNAVEPPRGMMYRLRWSLLKRIGHRSIVADLGRYKVSVEFSNASSRLMYFGDYEKDEQRVIATNVKPGMTVLDVGANLGYFTLLMASLVGSSGKVIAFEPNPRMRGLLDANIALNTDLNDGRLKAESLALGAERGRLKFYCPLQGHEGVGGLRDTQRAPVEKVVDVEATTLDAYVEQQKIDRIDFIKLDIEGGELGFFKGAQRVLTQMRPTVLFEATDKNTAAYGYKATDLHGHLKALGYEISDAGSDENFLAVAKR
jgi:FkbM family methyltransferase